MVLGRSDYAFEGLKRGPLLLSPLLLHHPSHSSLFGVVRSPSILCGRGSSNVDKNQRRLEDSSGVRERSKPDGDEDRIKLVERKR